MITDRVVTHGGKAYRVERLQVSEAVPDHVLADAVARRIAGGSNPIVRKLANLLAKELLERPGALRIEEMNDYRAYGKVVGASILVCIES